MFTFENALGNVSNYMLISSNLFLPGKKFANNKYSELYLLLREQLRIIHLKIKHLSITQSYDSL